MARNIAAAGIPLQVWNRTRAKADPLAEVGASVCDDPGEAVDGADIVLTMLWDAAGVEDVLRRAAGHFARDAVLLQMTTVGVEGADRLGRLAGELGLTYVDAPVSGTKQPAEQGTLVVLASGPGEAAARVAPVLDAVGSRTMWVGDAGAGSRLKLAVNAFLVSMVSGIAQSLSLARELGLDPEAFLEAVHGGAMDAPYVQLKGKTMLAGDFTPAFALDGALKDADLAAEAARSVGLDAGLIDALRHQLRRVSDTGHGEEDLSAVYRAYDLTR
jgi:3-hydroxyisobutyrate dehydrogenase